MHKLLNFVGFQVCWFANVLFAARGLPWAGPLVVLAWLALHFMLLRSDATPDYLVLLAAGVMGWLADSLLVVTGLLAIDEAASLGGPSPLWMVALWVGFAATLRHSLVWLRGRWWLGAVLGAVAGPLAYLGGQALGAILLTGNAALIAVAAQYAIATPVLLAIARYSERRTRVSKVTLESGARS